jgi:hypothetical protein
MLALIYVASAGPMAWLCRHKYISLGTGLLIYFPLEWASKASTTFRNFFDWYMGLFPP